VEDLIDPGLAGEYKSLAGDDRRANDIIGVDKCCC